MKNYSHPLVISIFEKIENGIPILSSGTYNQADPTFWAKGEISVPYKGREVILRKNDCTWGVTISISLLTRFKRKEIKFGEFYINHGFGSRSKTTVISKQVSTAPLKLARILSNTLQPIELPNYPEDDPMGCLADYI